jgi:hypothetical protein
VGHGQLHRFADGLDLHGAERPALCLELGPELVARAVTARPTSRRSVLKGDRDTGIRKVDIDIVLIGPQSDEVA